MLKDKELLQVELDLDVRSGLESELDLRLSLEIRLGVRYGKLEV